MENKILINGKYKKESAAKSAISDVPVFFENQNIEDIREEFLEKVETFETINYIYLVDEKNILKGVISIKDVLNREITGIAKDFMERNIIFVQGKADREKVVFLALKNNLKAIPVVDKENKFLGVVPSDKILSILQEESEEDVFLSKGFLIDNSIKNIENTTVKQFALLRSPWLIFGLFGGIIAAKVIGIFEETIVSFISLSFFIPIIVYLSDAVSTQSATIFIRGMALNSKVSVFKYFIREIKVGAILGIILGGMLSFISYIGWGDFRLSLILLFSVFFGVIFSVMFAILTPLFLWKMKKDPAFGTNPIATIISDILSIAVYLIIATLMISFFN